MIESVYQPDHYTIGASQQDFNIGFEFVSDADIRASVTDAETGVVTLLVNGDDFTVEAGPKITTGAQYDEGDKMTVYMVMPFKQLTQYLNTGRWDLPTTGLDLDIATLERQQLKEETDRAVKVTVESEDDPDELIATLQQASLDAIAAAEAAAASAALCTDADNIDSGNLGAAFMPTDGVWTLTGGGLAIAGPAILHQNGIEVGGSGTSKQIDDSSNGAASLPLFIGNRQIMVGAGAAADGVGEIYNPDTAVSVLHGVVEDIAPSDIIITPTDEGDVGGWWVTVDNVGSSPNFWHTFTVHVNTTPASVWGFSWRVLFKE